MSAPVTLGIIQRDRLPPSAPVTVVATQKGRESLRDELVYRTARDPANNWWSWHHGPDALRAARRKFPDEAKEGGLLAIGKTSTAECWTRVKTRLIAEDGL
jgi:hypothetical protein